MSVSAVSDAVFAWLDPNQGSGITYLGTVYQALPKVANEADLFTFTPPGGGVGATIYMFFKSSYDERISLGGPHNGRVAVPHELVLLCVFKSDLSEADDAEAAYNTFEDSLVARIRANRTAGTDAEGSDTGAVFQWGEGGIKGAGPDIRIERNVPKTAAGGVILVHNTVSITTIEIIQD